MSSRILGANRGLEWHRAVAPGVEVGEITTHGLALSRPRRGFESRWSHHTRLLRNLRNFRGTRTNLSLAKDPPETRSVQPPSQGRVVEVPRVGGLHHEYLRDRKSVV